MSNGEIDRLPVSLLSERYGIVRSAVYTRLESLGIKTQKVGNKAFVNAEQIKLLDELHRVIERGGTTAEFLESRGLEKLEGGTEEEAGLSTELSTGQSSDLVQLVTAIANIVSQNQPPPAPPDRLAYFRDLEEAAQKGWILKTSEVAYLLDILPSELQHYGDTFSDAGFVFTRSGYRAGEVAWRVSKPVK
jgi:hypothetical protein